MCGFHYSTLINKPLRKPCSKISKSWGFLEQDSFTVFTRPFSSQPNIKKKKVVWLCETSGTVRMCMCECTVVCGEWVQPDLCCTTMLLCAGQTPLHYVMLDNGPHAMMVLRMLCKYPLDTDVRDKKTSKTVLELCNTKGRKRLMPLLVEAIQTWNDFKEAVVLGLDKPEVGVYSTHISFTTCSRIALLSKLCLCA